jgi:hypothetical protein
MTPENAPAGSPESRRGLLARGYREGEPDTGVPAPQTVQGGFTLFGSHPIRRARVIQFPEGGRPDAGLGAARMLTSADALLLNAQG